jgi:hypothetical protein
MYSSAFGGKAVAGRCDEISIYQERYCALNHFVRSFFLEGLVQRSYVNIQSASPLILFVEEIKNLFRQFSKIDH